MNIFKKIKNWLIKKLGGYTREECTEVVDKWDNALELNKNLYEIEENRLRIAESNVEYWCDKYTAEHNAYIALLNLHNATAEAAQKMVTPVEMAKAIKAYCAERDDCEGCDLHNTEHCKLSYKACPEYWEVE